MLVLKKGQCRKIKTSLHNPNGAKWCENCSHYSLIDLNNLCECCKLKISNKKRFSELKTFEKIVNLNYYSILEWMAMPTNPDFNFGWSVRIGIINYFVPVRYLAEYLELPNLEGVNLEKNFLENIKKECVVLGRYIHSIK